MRIDKDFIIGGLLVTLVIIVIGSLITLYYLVDRYKCSVKTRDVGEYEFTIIGGCMVKPEGTDKFIPLENYRVI